MTAPSRVSAVALTISSSHLTASALLPLSTRISRNAKNLFAFLEILVDKGSKALAVKWDDEIVKATALTRDGAVIHPSFAPKSAA